MKLRIMALLLAASLAAYAQHGRPSGMPSGPPSNAGAGAGMGSGRDMGAGMGTTHGRSGEMGNSATRSTDIGKQSPDVLSTNTKLSSKLDKLLPSGMTAKDACSGFKNLGQCIAAIHVSNNLGISFADLKSKMTGSGAVSLGTAIHEIKPDVSAKAEARKAQKQANQDLQQSVS